jgi:phosphate transport system permease protein
MVNTVISNIPQPGADLRLVYDRYVRYLLFTSAALMSIIVLSIIFFMGQQGLQTFREVSPMEFFFSTRWDPLDEKFGGAGFIVGSVYAAVLAVIFGAPLGLAGAVFMAKIAPKRVREIMRPANDLYVAIPSVVYGYLGLTVLVPFLRDELKLGMGFGLFAAGLILGIMILPTVISISEDALRSVPSSLEEASIALGATRWQTIWKVLIPTAMPGIMTAVILAMARAIGETMAVQMVIGNSPLLAKSLFTPTATLTSEIVVEMGNAPFNTAYGNSLFLMALVLLLMSLLLIVVIRGLIRKGVAQ